MSAAVREGRGVARGLFFSRSRRQRRRNSEAVFCKLLRKAILSTQGPCCGARSGSESRIRLLGGRGRCQLNLLRSPFSILRRQNNSSKSFELKSKPDLSQNSCGVHPREPEVGMDLQLGRSGSGSGTCLWPDWPQHLWATIVL